MTDNNPNNSSPNASEAADASNIDLDGITDVEKYFLHSKGEIVQKLRLLGKGKSAINGYFNHGNDFFLTSVIDVLRDKNILVLDITPDAELNKKIIDADNIIFKAKHLGISAQFKAASIQTAKFKGQQLFACAIPDDLLWVQRREHFRVHIPLSNNAVFQIKTAQGDISEYPIIDVSGGGIAIADKSFALKVEADDEFNNVSLLFNDELSCTTDLIVQNTLPLYFDKPSAGQRIGCRFNALLTDFSADLQRYINLLDSHYRKTLSD
ncbi:hypothetical protein MNBD_GAMMA23-1128 [hydrothermal vent metagenome]|uniref:Type III secretion system flagellar brake protein YcgR PilZN domain-containing protein n=1 Tax=hydrothermal vent metagenome TaxID=652676 RepID=A0A3B1A1W4_9ZZZZ